jgi:hypothetical protein
MRTRPCGPEEARGRLSKAKAFLVTAQTALGDLDDVAGANAVLAAIAAADALCCTHLGRMSRSLDHGDAVTLVRDVQPSGRKAATALERCLQVRRKAEYDARPLANADAARAVRHAGTLVGLAELAVP